MPKMSADELIQNVYRKATGELDDTVTHENEDGKTVLSVINEQIEYYYNAVDHFGDRVVWARNIDPEYVIGDANQSDTTYPIDWDSVQALPAGFYMPIRIRMRDGSEVRYDLVPIEELYDERSGGKNKCAITGEGLTFASPPEHSGEIVYPCVSVGKKLEGGEKDVESASGVHNLLWLQFAAAAEYVRTDIVRGEQYPNVLAQANDVFNRMLSDNEMRTAALSRESGTATYDW